MNGHQAYRYYMAIKLHFTTPNFNVFVNGGRVKSSYESFLARRDYKIFEKIARQYPEDKQCIQYFASNFMYGNPNVVYQQDEAASNFNLYLKRKQSITRVFQNDVDFMIDNKVRCNLDQQIPDVLNMWMCDKITLETVVIINSFDNFVDKMKQSDKALLFSDELLRIEKSKGFVKFSPEKTIGLYNRFVEETGQDHE